MSFTEPVNLQDYIERLALIFEDNKTLFPLEADGESLVTKVIRNKPAIEQSAEDGVIPYILIFESGQPIRFYEKAGRDSRDVEGGTVYEIEIYCVAITNNDLLASEAQFKIHDITQAMRTALSKNMRLVTPGGTGEDPLCRTHERFEIPYILRGEVPATMYARNIVVRAQVYINSRG